MSPSACDNDTCSSHAELQVPSHNQLDSVPLGQSQPAIRQGKLVAYFAFFSHPISGMILVLVQTAAWLTSFLERFQSATMCKGEEGEKSPSVRKAVV